MTGVSGPAPRFGEATLSDCDREPIHVPGAIQPHGVLLAVDCGGRVVRAAGDCAAILGGAGGDPLGEPLAAVVGEDAAGRILAARAVAGTAHGERRVAEFGVPVPGGAVDVAVHESGGLLVAELERAGPPADPGATLHRVHRMLRRVEEADGLDAVLRAAAEEVQGLSGFDRVMVYRFLEDGSGTVAAEVRQAGQDSFLGLRYPASDVPRQARALYIECRLRLIADATAEPAPIRALAGARADEPLDLTFSTLRAVSPIHLKYLGNLGVAASMSISLVRGGRLWGLIACHHRTARHVPYRVREACELFGQAFSLQLGARLSEADYAERRDKRAVQSRLVANLAEAGHLEEGFATHLPLLLDLVPAEGVASLVHGRYAAHGMTPDRSAVERLATSLADRRTRGVFSTRCLAEDLPEVADIAAGGLAGLLAMPVSTTPRDYVLWFRPEVVETVTWAGDPRKPVDRGEDGTLDPRASFAAWRETVRGRSEPFRAAEVDAAEGLRLSILEAVVRRAEEVARERAAAQERQTILLAELDHRVKNILANIEALMRQTRLSSGTLEGYVTALENRVRAMAHAQSLLSESRWRSASLTRLAREELAPYDGGTGCVDVEGPEVSLAPKAALAIAMVLHELATNAAKYGALSVGEGRLSVRWERGADGLSLAWRERGGPPVKPPARRGFGRTLVERSLAYELGGTVDLRFASGGVECDLLVPDRYVMEEGQMEERDGHDPARVEAAPPRVLILEDSVLFAFDLEERVRALDCEVAGPTGRLEEALAIVEREPLDLAVLDVNLGDRDSFPVADALAARGVPFLFLTGYDARAVIPSRLSDVPCLSKPVADAEFAATVRRLLGRHGAVTGG